MQTEQENAPWKKLHELVELDDAVQLQVEADQLGAREGSRALSRLGNDDQSKILTMLEPERVARFLEELSEAQAAELISKLPAETAAPIVAEMDSGYAADMMAVLSDSHAETVLDSMHPETAQSLRMLGQFPADVAGGIMITEYLAFPDTATTRSVIADLRANTDAYKQYSVQYTYVVTETGKLIGVLPLRNLLLTPGNVPITDVMIANPLAAQANASLEELSDLFEAHTFLAVPVVDSDGTLLGVLERQRLDEAFGERAQDDYRKAQGIVGGDELRSMPLLRRSRRRLSWLSVNILLNIVAASVIAIYQDTLSSVIALAVFLPIISDMSGCSGNQAVAVSMRELSLGIIKPLDTFYVWLKEISLGAINGLALGVLIGIAASLYGKNPYLGGVVGGALCINTMVAVSIGGLVPLVLKRFGVDPALASGPCIFGSGGYRSPSPPS